MEIRLKLIGCLACVALGTELVGCATAPPLTDAGARVRMVSVEATAGCKFVQVIQYTDRILGLGKDPTVMKAIGETNLRNRVAAADANTFVLTKDDSNWFLGNVAYQGDAYRCPQ